MSQPLYYQLSEKLIVKITEEMEVGDYLPSERKLTEIYDVSRTTVRLTLKELESKGYISKRHGKGSIVVNYHEKMVNLSEMYSFTEEMKSMGKTPKTILLDYSIISNTSDLNEIFTGNEDQIIKVVRLRLVDEIPMLYEESYIPYSKFHEITIEDINQRSLYDIFSEDFNEVVKLAMEEFSVGIALIEEAANLDINESSPVLEIYRTTINTKNEVIEYTESKARPDKFTYQTVHHNRMNS